MISQRPNLRILEAHMEHYEELSNDALSIRGYQNLRSNDYHLGGYNIGLIKRKKLLMGLYSN